MFYGRLLFNYFDSFLSGVWNALLQPPHYIWGTWMLLYRSTAEEETWELETVAYIFSPTSAHTEHSLTLHAVALSLSLTLISTLTLEPKCAHTATVTSFAVPAFVRPTNLSYIFKQKHKQMNSQ